MGGLPDVGIFYKGGVATPCVRRRDGDDDLNVMATIVRRPQYIGDDGVLVSGYVEGKFPTTDIAAGDSIIIGDDVFEAGVVERFSYQAKNGMSHFVTVRLLDPE